MVLIYNVNNRVTANFQSRLELIQVKYCYGYTYQGDRREYEVFDEQLDEVFYF